MAFTTLLRKSIYHKFKDFSKHCTMHGFYYFYDNTRWWVHGIWMFILTSSLLLCCYLSHMIWEKFVDDPTLTVVRLNFKRFSCLYFVYTKVYEVAEIT